MQTEQKETSGVKSGRVRSLSILAVAVALAGAAQGCGGGGGGVCNPPQVGATWSIDKQATGAGLTCEQAAAVTVEMTLNGTPFDFPCGAYNGLTTALTPGNYNADFTLLDGAGNVLSQTGQMTVTVHSCGITDLGDVLFDVQ